MILTTSHEEMKIYLGDFVYAKSHDKECAAQKGAGQKLRTVEAEASTDKNISLKNRTTKN